MGKFAQQRPLRLSRLRAPGTLKASLYFFLSPESLAQLFLLKEFNLSSDHKVLKLLLNILLVECQNDAFLNRDY